MATAVLRVWFRPEGFWLLGEDIRTRVTLDGRPIFEGPFAHGFDVRGPVDLGDHVLETAILLGAMSRTRRYNLCLDAAQAYRSATPEFEARIGYSRLWGNFARRLELSRK